MNACLGNVSSVLWNTTASTTNMDTCLLHQSQQYCKANNNITVINACLGNVSSVVWNMTASIMYSFSDSVTVINSCLASVSSI